MKKLMDQMTFGALLVGLMMVGNALLPRVARSHVSGQERVEYVVASANDKSARVMLCSAAKANQAKGSSNDDRKQQRKVGDSRRSRASKTAKPLRQDQRGFSWTAGKPRVVIFNSTSG